MLDIWERLGEDNDKLMDPFYSKLADELNQNHNINKICIGTGGNFPKIKPYIDNVNVNIEFNGEHPYPCDSKRKYAILTESHEMNGFIELNRLMLDEQTNDDDIKQFSVKNLGIPLEEIISISNKLYNPYYRNVLYKESIYAKICKESNIFLHPSFVNESWFENAILGGKSEISELIIKNNVSLLKDISYKELGSIFAKIADKNLSYKAMTLLRKSTSDKELINKYVCAALLQ